MKRIILATVILLVLIGAAIAVSHKPPKHIAHVSKPAPVHLTYGIKKPYTDCMPNQPETDQTKLQQDEILNVVGQMAKYNNTPNNTNNPDLQRLTQLHANLIAQYDTCSDVN